MAWNDGADKSTGDVITATIWNNYLGTAGSIQKTAPAVVTTAGDLVYGTADNTIARLGVGSARQILQTNAAANAPEWVASPQSLLDAKGEILGASAANTLGALAAGTNDYVLTADSSESLGVKWAAAGGGAWTLEGSITSEQTTTSTSDTVIATISSLNIPAGKPIMIIGQTRNSGGTATGTFFLGMNGSAIGNSSNTNTSYASTLFSSGNNGVSLSVVYLGMRGSDYVGTGINAMGWTMRDSTVVNLTNITNGAALPTAAITSIDVRGNTSNAAVTAIVGPTYVYSMAIS